MKDLILIDPDLDPLVVRARWEVLNLLRGVGRDERGVGKSLTTVELGELLEPVLGELGIDGKRIGQAGRWFAGRAEGHPQLILYWGNGNPARFGLRRESSNVDVDRVIAAYTGRLAACALAREVDEGELLDGAPHVDFDPSGESPEDRAWASAPCARKEIEAIEERRIGETEISIPPVDRELEPIFLATVGKRASIKTIPIDVRDRAFSIHRVNRISERILEFPPEDRLRVVSEFAALASRVRVPSNAFDHICNVDLVVDFLESKLSERASILFRVAHVLANVARDAAKDAYELARELHDE